MARGGPPDLLASGELQRASVALRIVYLELRPSLRERSWPVVSSRGETLAAAAAGARIRLTEREAEAIAAEGVELGLFDVRSQAREVGDGEEEVFAVASLPPSVYRARYEGRRGPRGGRSDAERQRERRARLAEPVKPVETVDERRDQSRDVTGNVTAPGASPSPPPGSPPKGGSGEGGREAPPSTAAQRGREVLAALSCPALDPSAVEPQLRHLGRAVTQRGWSAEQLATVATWLREVPDGWRTALGQRAGRLTIEGLLGQRVDNVHTASGLAALMEPATTWSRRRTSTTVERPGPASTAPAPQLSRSEFEARYGTGR